MLYYKDSQNNTHYLNDVKILPQGCTLITWEEVQDLKNPPTIEQLKDRKYQKIREDFAKVVNNDVGIYQGGFDSAIKLDAAKRLAEAAGQTQTTFYDADNIAHTLTLAEAQNIIIAVALAYQSSFAVKQGRMVIVKNATTAEEINLA